MPRTRWRSATLALAALALAACGGSGGGGGGGGAPAFGDLALEGTVLYVNGDPAPNIAVRIAGRGPFVTGAGGKFVVNDAPVPYDAIVFNGADGQVEVWQGLTRSDPVFTLGIPGPETPFEADVEGNVSGGVGLPVPATHETRVVFGVEGAVGSASASPDSTTGDYVEMDVQWFGPVAGTLHVHALQYEADSQGAPITFSGYGTTIAPVLAGDTLLNQDIVMGPVGTSPINGTVSSVTPLLGYASLLYVGLPGDAALFLSGSYQTAPNFALQAPQAPGVVINLLVSGLDASGNSISAFYPDLPLPTTGLGVDLPAATGLVLPVDGASNVGYETAFSVTPSQTDRVYRAWFRPKTDPGPEIVLVTRDSTFRIPDLRAYDVPLIPGTEYSWSVRALGPAASVDDVAVESDIPIYLRIFGAFEGFTAGTDTRSVHTAP